MLGLIDTLNDKTVVHDRVSALYFSVTTWTTVGFGDLVPSKDTRFFAALEALISYLAMGLFLLILLGVFRKTHPDPLNPKGGD